MIYTKFKHFVGVLLCILLACSTEKKLDYPDPATHPLSTLMLEGDWFEEPHSIDFANLQKLEAEHIVISDVRPEGKDFDPVLHDPQGGVNQHNYITFYQNKFWIMWSHGPGVEDRVGQIVKYATSKDGRNWSSARNLTNYADGSGPESPHYNTRTLEGLRWIARGFWQREGELLALMSLDEAAGFFGPSLQLRAMRWNEDLQEWEDAGMVYDNAINNFPPKKLPNGEWMMSRRPYDYTEKGVDFLAGGLESISSWSVFPVLGSESELTAEEPYWWTLPDGKSLMALFRDNRKSGYLYRSFSTDNGRNWSLPVKTNFPDARSKFHGLRLADGRYILVSNPNPEKRDPLALSISEDGMVFNNMYYLVGGRRVDYPHVMQHNDHIYIAFSGGKQSVELLILKTESLDK
ncbi:MAG: exo-alpha-sialidase [Cyclobacteriaceae bacterium]|nr:exo-alpha-sialidase [Cyclobacteriaceae bacterium]